MEKEKSIEVLNTLITINNDRIEGYETATKETEEKTLKHLFTQFTTTSQKCKEELVSEVIKLGGKPEEGISPTGIFFRAWIDVKAALTGKDRKAILNSCEYGEEIAVASYNKALRNNMQDISAEQQTMLNAQHTRIKADLVRIKKLSVML